MHVGELYNNVNNEGQTYKKKRSFRDNWMDPVWGVPKNNRVEMQMRGGAGKAGPLYYYRKTLGR